MPKADIEIKPKLEPITLDYSITADKSANSADASKKIIPAFFLQEEKEGSMEFNATGSVAADKKASGIITIYNKLTPTTPFTLIKGTHFLSNSGKYFITLDKVTVPAGNYSKGKLVPGSIGVKVEAKETGEAFNIEPSSFSVPKLSGTIYYYSISGESKNAMAGGYTGNLKKITKEDIENAKNTLAEKLYGQGKESMQKRLSESHVLLAGAIVKEVLSFSASQEAEKLTENFTATAKVKLSALAFKSEDIENIAKKELTALLPDYKKLLEDSLKITYVSEQADIEKGTMQMALGFSADAYFQIDTADLIDLFSNKTEGEIKNLISTRHGENIAESKVDLWPFWVKKAPKDKNRIKIELNFQ